ncbi:MAG TPA: hypothetical protein VGZ28_14195 [Terriglobales bacterium]|jgi:hypothetical protein|nr:hypothetical protein [Terriglobales bacterium]
MRGQDAQQLGVFSYVSPEQRILHDHPLRQLHIMADEALRELKPRFSSLIRPDWTAIDSTGVAGDSADAFFATVLQQARSRDLLSDEHLTVDGTLLEA